MTRVAILIDSLQTGGAQKLIAAYVAHASDHDLEPTVVNLREGSSSVICDAIRDSGANVITVSARSLFNWKRLRWLVRFLRESRIDIVQSHLLYANILGSVAAFLARIPVICTLHSTHSEKGWRLRILKKIEDFCLRHLATRILAVGDKVALAQKGRYAGRRVDVIPNGIPEPGTVPMHTRQQVRSEIVGNDGHSIIITVGRFEPSKGYHDMIDAFKLLREKNSRSVLLMVGSGSLHNDIRSQVKALDLERSVILAGERHDIPQLLASSDVFASSSHREGLPLSVLEAMMAGLPIVATSVGDIPNVVTDDVGVVVPPHKPEQLADALDELLKNPDRRQAMGKAARDRALSEYSVDVWMKRHVDLYRDVLQRSEKQSAP